MVEESSEAPSQPVRTDRRRELARIQGEQKKRRVAFALIGTFILVIVGIIVAGYVMIFVLPPRELIVRVDNVEYTRGDMVKLLRVRQRGTELQGETFNAGTDIFGWGHDGSQDIGLPNFRDLLRGRPFDGIVHRESGSVGEGDLVDH